ncbi:AFG1-like ATPase [Mycobacteroides abscessus]|nr:AFG1-like ATPase [Mycobacteroides abscessus]
MSDPQSGAALCLQHLADRHPTVSNERLIAQLVPPPTFSSVSFDSYRPDPNEPTQTAAVEACRAFAQEATTRRAGKKKLFGKREVLPGVGIYLDGGSVSVRPTCWRRSITRCPARRRLRASAN